VNGPIIEDDSQEGVCSRARLAGLVEESDQGQYNPIGLSLGYHYHGSPLIAGDDFPPPEYADGDYRPSASAGARLPHFRLPDGSPVHDHLGRDFTLLRVGPRSVDAGPLVCAMAERRLPLKVVDIPNVEALRRCGKRLVLVRPDQHVAWRDDRVPNDPAALVDRIRGCRATVGALSLNPWTRSGVR
jgi:hypothetical protein